MPYYEIRVGELTAAFRAAIHDPNEALEVAFGSEHPVEITSSTPLYVSPEASTYSIDFVLDGAVRMRAALTVRD